MSSIRTFRFCAGLLQSRPNFGAGSRTFPNLHRSVSIGTSLYNENRNNETAAATSESTREVVYVGSMDSTVYSVKHFSLFTSGLILAAQPIIWDKWTALNSVLLQSAIGGGFAFFFMGTPILIHHFTKKYVIHMTLDNADKSFEVTTYSFLLKKKKIKFCQSDITIPTTPLPFTTIYAKGHPLLFTPDGWKSRYAYDHLMLLDKDAVDWTKIKAEAMKK